MLVRGGSYPELSVKDDNRRSSMLTLKAYTGESVTLNGFDVSKASHVRVEGFRITDWVDFTDGARQVALVGNDISPRGVRMKGVDGVLVEGNTIHDLVPDADGKCSCGIWIQSWGSIGPARNVTMRGNTITRLSNDGINLANVVNILIEGNTIKDALSIGNGAHVDSIHLMGGDNITLRGNRLEHNQHGLMFTDHQPRNVTIENNLVVGITNGMGMKTAGEEDMPNLKVINNTFYNNQAAVQFRARHTNAIVRNNIFDRVGGLDDQPIAEHNLIGRPESGKTYGTNAILKAPLFVNTTSWELAPGSPGIDAGTSTGAPSTDRLGRPRSDDPNVRNRGGAEHVDLGANERQAGRLVVQESARVGTARRRGIAVLVGVPTAERFARIELRREGRAKRLARRTMPVPRGSIRLRLRSHALEPGTYVVTVRFGSSPTAFGRPIVARVVLTR